MFDQKEVTSEIQKTENSIKSLLSETKKSEKSVLKSQENCLYNPDLLTDEFLFGDNIPISVEQVEALT